MPVPEDMRHTVQVKLRLTEEAAELLRTLPAGQRSAWVSALIVKAKGRIAKILDGRGR